MLIRVFPSDTEARAFLHDTENAGRANRRGKDSSERLEQEWADHNHGPPIQVHGSGLTKWPEHRTARISDRDGADRG